MSDPTAVTPSTAVRMEPGELRELIAAFITHLTRLGYTRLTARGYEDSARHFGEWLARSGMTIADVNDGSLERFAHHRCCCAGARRSKRLSRKYVGRVRRFVRFLADRKIIATPPPIIVTIDPNIALFQDWLRRHRGLSERTISRHSRMISRLLPALGADPGVYDAERVRRVILDETKRCSTAYVKTMSMALRGYLRFLAARGVCRPGLDHAVPPAPCWRLSALPRYLPAADVERLVDASDQPSPCEIRDRAILLLLARLGLRAHDVMAMELDDIAWAEGVLRVRGKSRREVRLPLPQDVGDALLVYIEEVRPCVDEAKVFLRSMPPYCPFGTSSVISGIVRRGLERAGITNAPSYGAHLLRHSAATSMLRAGATLEAIGAVLRHRSVDSTAHYAKVDVQALSLIAQPWPEGV
ncbi:MAG: tyrosine-type recombinase/integrase [Geminicoccaceae bacterium]